jgi:TonB family protein
MIMMMKRQTSPWARMKALFVLPVAFVAVTVISCTSPKEKKSDADQEVVQQSQPASAPEIQVVTYAPQPKEVEQGEIFQVVEERPQFPGGDAELMKFLQQNVKYPKEAQEQGKQGRVIVQFVVNKDGSISNDTIVRSVDPSLDAEAVRIVRNMPNWTPGKQKGEPVRVRFTLPVTFRLSGDAPKQAAEVKQAEATGDEIFKVVEDRPQFPGGDAELMKFLQQNVKYPKEAQEQGKQGRVIVQFVVEKDGSITDAKVLKPVDPLLDAEALRIVNMMPKWTPGKQRGKAVRVYFTIPVTFRLSN